jgi:hypothetical protein
MARGMWWSTLRSGLSFADKDDMSSRRSVRLIGALYVLIAVSAFLVYPFPAAVLLPSLHLSMGVWALVASRHTLSAITFSRKAAVLLGILALAELYVPSLALGVTSTRFAGGVAVIHLAAAVLAAYYGYYWTDAVSESDRKSAKTA